MGSWNETCVLSRLPISIGDDVVCILADKFVLFDPANLASEYHHIYMINFTKYGDYGETDDPSIEKKYEEYKDKFDKMEDNPLRPELQRIYFLKEVYDQILKHIKETTDSVKWSDEFKELYTNEYSVLRKCFPSHVEDLDLLCDVFSVILFANAYRLDLSEPRAGSQNSDTSFVEKLCRITLDVIEKTKNV